MNSLLQHLVGQLAIRTRIWLAVLLLAGMVLLPIPLVLGGQQLRLSELQSATQEFTETERSLLAARAHIEASRAKLLDYLDGRALTATGALAETEQSLTRLDAVMEVPGTILIQDSTGSVAELRAEVRDLRLALDEYHDLIQQIQSARSVDDADRASGIATQALDLVERLASTAERLIAESESARILSESAARADTRSWMIRAGLTYALGSAASLWLAFVLVRSVTKTVDTLRAGAERLSATPSGPLVLGPVALDGDNELAIVADALNKLSADRAHSYQLLESRVEERTESLGQRIRQLQAVIEVAQIVADLSTLSDASTRVIDLDILLQQIVDVIQRRLSLYYVGLFLVEKAPVGETPISSLESIVLRAGTGEAGAGMIARGHRLSANEGMIGWCVANGQARVALEAETDLLRVINPELPATRSEAAIPLRTVVDSEDVTDSIVDLMGDERPSVSRRSVMGALTVQDDRPGAFDEGTIELLQLMADLLAVMIDNARRYRDVSIALEAVRRSYRQQTREGWMRLLSRESAATGYLLTGSERLTSLENRAMASPDWDQSMRQAMGTQQVVESDGTLVVPIAARGQTIGAVRLQRSAAANDNGRQTGDPTPRGQATASSPDTPEGAQPWSSKERGLVQTIVEQLGLALDSARLYEDTQNAAVLEQVIGEMTSRVRAEVEIEAVLERALAELGQVLGAERGSAFLAFDEVGLRSDGITSSDGSISSDGSVSSDGSISSDGREEVQE